ncbi:conjugal transfer protein TraF [Thiomicrospira microaerophila]|uniref:conjugal transfer protein TraF n=1 Tax=Thiomicrospira microaerophila TaxID=406020 RepID=UPI0005CA5111|nr:conjugal transfer protein TraF [Thiomicrospira microaerophila]
MFKHKILVTAIAMASSSMVSASTFYNAGSTLGYGDVGNTHTLFNGFQNPASLGGDTSKRLWGLGLSAGIDISYTGMSGIEDRVENVQNELDDLSDRLATRVGALDQATVIANPTQVANDLKTGLEEDLEGVVDGFFTDFSNLGMQLQTSFSLPLVIQTHNWGGWMVGASVTSGAAIKLNQSQGSDLNVDVVYAPTEANPNNFTADATAQTNAALNITGYHLTEATLGYGMDLDRWFTLGEGSLNAGFRVKMMQASFKHYAFGLDSIINNPDQDFSDEISDGIQEAITSSDTSTAFGVDFGLQYNAKNYMLGLTLENLNAPSFEYGAIGQDAANLIASNHLPSEISLDPKARVEAALFSKNRRWTLAGFADLNKTTAITGLETQKAGISASYASNLWYAPDIRFGYTHEAAGNEFSRMHGGLTVGFVSLDLALSSLDFEEFEDNSLALNLAVEFKF